jgi:hypothetical protein
VAIKLGTRLAIVAHLEIVNELANVGEAAMTERKKNDRRWSHKVKTISTFPPAGIFTKDAQTIARSLAARKLAPRGSAPEFAWSSSSSTGPAKT